MKIFVLSILLFVSLKINAQIFKVLYSDTSLIEQFENTNNFIKITEYSIKWGHRNQGEYYIYKDSAFNILLSICKYDTLGWITGIEYHYHENGKLQSKIDWDKKKYYWIVPEHKTFDKNGKMANEMIYDGDTLLGKYYDLNQRLRIMDKEYIDPDQLGNIYFYHAEWDSLGNLIKVEHPDYFRK